MSRSDKSVRSGRFFVDVDVAADTVEITDADMLSQWRTVLRLKVGDVIVLIDPTGMEGQGPITEMTKSSATVAIRVRKQNAAEPEVQVTLYCAMLKRENFEWVAQKAVETGVHRVVPMMTDHTVKLGMKRERLETIMREAAEQSGRGVVPPLADPMSFADAIKDSASANGRYFFDIGAPIQPEAKANRSVALFIGPEGGWSEPERIAAASAGLTTVGLGKRVLRAETAAIVATYLFAK